VEKSHLLTYYYQKIVLLIIHPLEISPFRPPRWATVEMTKGVVFSRKVKPGVARRAKPDHPTPHGWAVL